MKKINPKIILMNSIVWILPIILMSMTIGCATHGINPTLAKAQASYQAAKDNPDVEKNAAVALYEAKKSLDKATKAESVKDIEREASRAERQVQIAIAQTEQKIAEQKIDLFTKENETLLLERSRRQADQRGMEANQARQEADQMKKDAETKAMEAERLRMEAEKTKEELAQSQKDLAELQAKETERGLVLTLRDVLFETGKAQLLSGAMWTVQKVADFLLKNPDRNVLIEGHTDSVGGEDYNLGLSEQRADSVRRALIDDDVSPERITIKGYGERFPVAGNDTPEGRQQNRRVEIVIMNEGVTAKSLFR
jgi:outer membrane protein OmpA-like peptidoglycan-associated protein